MRDIVTPDNNVLLTGPIPTEIGLLPSLSYVTLSKSIDRFSRVDCGFCLCFVITLYLAETSVEALPFSHLPSMRGIVSR
jgi:hypothetical protein